VNREEIFRNVPAAQASSVKNIVELVIVCDKELSELFNYDEKKLLDYYTIALWDINLRYKTLPSVDISIRLNGIVVISVLHSICKYKWGYIRSCQCVSNFTLTDISLITRVEYNGPAIHRGSKRFQWEGRHGPDAGKV